MNDIVKLIVEWCAQNGHAESRFLGPNPAHFVYTFDLFDALAESTGISQDQIGEWFNAEQERRELLRRW